MKNIQKILVFLLIFTCIFSVTCFANNTVNPLENLGGTNGFNISSNNMHIAGLTDSNSSGGQVEAWNIIFKEYRGVILGVSGVAALTFLALFVINFMKLGATAGNPQMRSQCLASIIGCGIGCACCGGVTLFVGFFSNLLV